MMLSLQQFKRDVTSRTAGHRVVKRGQAATPGATIRKDFYGAPISVANLGERCIRFTLSTSVVDRAMDTVDPAGWDLVAYRANPVVLWQHDQMSLPIARCIEIGIDGSSLYGVAEFVRQDMPEIGPMAEAVRLMCVEGFLSAVSVGFRPLDFDVTNDPERGADDWCPGFDFRRQELTEWSIVTVPCNPETLIDPALRQGDVSEDGAYASLVDPSIAAAAEAATVKTADLDARRRRQIQAIALG